MKRIAVLCRGTAQCLDRSSLSLIETARGLAGDHPISLFLFGPAPKAYPAGVDRIILFSDDAAPGPALPFIPGPDTQARWLARAILQHGADIVLAPANLWGRSVMPVAAALLGAGLTADCTQLWMDGEERLHQVRPAFGGKLLAEILSREGAPAMATVRTGGHTTCRSLCGKDRHTPLEAETALSFLGANYLTETVSPLQSPPKLESGRIIVAGGAGLGSAENFKVIQRLAGLLHGVPAASRAAVNAGYAPYSWQVGQSGHTVAPEVYLAIGISGAVQHLSGIRQAKKIIAVNPDAKAPIFDYADYGIITHWEPFTSAVINYFKEAENHEAG